MNRRVAVVLLLGTLCALPIAAQGRRRAVNPQRPVTALEWLHASAVPFDTTDARTGIADLQPLRNIVGDAGIVSLGEATHGTHEFFTMKHRILEFLVEEMGFTVFAIEGNLPEADRVDDYVVNGIGNPSAALAGMYFWTWNTDEVLDMIEWMREYNLRRGERPPVRFRGFDDQFVDYAVAPVEAYVQRVDPDRRPEITDWYDCIRPYDRTRIQAYKALTQSQRNACASNLQNVFDAIAGRRDDYVAHSTAGEYEKFLRYARVIVQTEAVWSGRGDRDQFMAENIQWLTDTAHPDAKFVLWAHNFHVSSDPRSMGGVLRTRFGSSMIIFGFDFDRGGFNAIDPNSGLGPQTIANGPTEGWEAFFRTTGLPRFFLDVRNPSSSDAKTYLAFPQAMWSIGSVWTGLAYNYRAVVGLPQRYDVIIYVETTKPSRLRPF